MAVSSLSTLTASAATSHISCFSASNETILSKSSLKLPVFWPWQKVTYTPTLSFLLNQTHQVFDEMPKRTMIFQFSRKTRSKWALLVFLQWGLGPGLGGNQLLWGYQESMDNELQQVFNLAVDNGINLFDTTDSYGTGKLNGQSEKLLGKFVREYKGKEGVRDNIVIATKFAAYPWRLTPGQFVNACKSSLYRMELEQIGIGQLHWSTANYAPLQERALWDGLLAMYDKGLVQAVGVSNYGPKQLEKIYKYLKDRGVPLYSAQVQFSLLSLGDEQIEVKNICDSLGIQLIAYSSLGLGMLTGKYTLSNLPSGPRSLLFRQILPGLEPLLRCLKAIASRRQKTMSQQLTGASVRVRFLYRVSKLSNKPQENLGALGWRLSRDEMTQLEDAAQQSPRKMIQNIFQTR